jgi:phosphate transport system substrate-binding protein
MIVVIISGCSRESVKMSRSNIRISGAWALYPMMLVWADEYMKLQPVEIEVSGGGAGKGISDVLSRQVDIGMVSRPIKNEELEQGAFYLAVTKDTVLGIIHEDNPFYADIQQKGLSQEDLRKIFTREVTQWGELFGKNIENDSIVVFGRSDSSGAASVWATYLGNLTEADLQNRSDSNVSGDQAIAGCVQDDPNAISFSNVNYVYDPITGDYIQKIRPVPIDLNGNGLLDENENFYKTRESFLKSVSNGTYPSPPTREEYLVGNGPFQEDVKDFIFWILNDGQNILEENGYIPLLSEEQKRELECLNTGIRK